MKTVYVIKDERGNALWSCGWAKNDPIEGWIFTCLENEATEFVSIEEAKAVMRKEYGISRAQLVVQERVKVEFTKSEMVHQSRPLKPLPGKLPFLNTGTEQ